MTNNYHLIQGDCLKVLPMLEKESVDLIVTSPPYEDIASAGYSGKTKDILFFKLYSEFLDIFFNEIFRVLKSTGQFFFNVKSKTQNKTLRTPHWIEFLESFQQFDFKSYIIWKYAGSFDSSKNRFHLDYEIIYHLSKTSNIYLNVDCGFEDPLSSFWYIPHYINERLHPTQMPELVVDRMINTSSKKESVVLDPFLGSGTTVKVAQDLNRSCIGIEINHEYCDIIKKRCFGRTFLDREVAYRFTDWNREHPTRTPVPISMEAVI